MNRQSHIRTLAAALALLAAPARAQESILEAYVREGLRNNESVQQQEFLLNKQEYAVKEATRMFFPDVAIQGMYTRADGGRAFVLPFGALLNPVYDALNALTASNRFPRVDDQQTLANPDRFYDAKFHVTVPVINPDVWFNHGIQQELLGVRKADVAVSRRDLARDIRVSYFKHWQASRSVEIYENALHLVEEQERVNRSLFANGKANRSAVVRAGSEVTRIRAALIEARYTRRTAQSYFNLLLRRPLLSDIVVDDSAMQVSPFVKAGGDTSVYGREELVGLRALRAADSYLHDKAWSFLIPRVSAFIDLGSQGFEWKFDAGSRYYFAGVTLEWNLFSSGRDVLVAQEALYELKALDAQAGYVERRLQLQLATAIDACETADAAYGAAVSQVQSADSYYRDQLALYRAGQSLYIELLDAQNQLIDAQLRESIARSTVLIRGAERERASGAGIAEQ